MATLTRLYPILKQMGLDDQTSQTFIQTLEEGTTAGLATTVDLEKVRADLAMKVEKVRADLTVEIEKVRTDLLRWLFGAWATLFPAVLGLFFKLH